MSEKLKFFEDSILDCSRSVPESHRELMQFNFTELQKLERVNYLPRELHIQPSRTCNFKCTMCSWETWQSNEGMMSMALFEKVLNDAKANQIKKIVFANAQGEPLLHPEIFTMIDKAVKAGFWTMVSTNGSTLNEKNTRSLLKTGIHNIQFSFAGYDRFTYESVYVGGKWSQISSQLAFLAKSILDFQSTTTLVINGCYSRELASLVSPNAFIAKTRAFLNSVGIGEPLAQIRIQLPHNFANNIIVTDGKGAQNKNSNFAKRTNLPGLCRVLQHAPGVYFDGKVTACGCLDPNGDLLIGDLNQDSIKDIRSQSTYQNMLQNFIQGDFSNMKLCSECDVPYYDNPNESALSWENLVKEEQSPPFSKWLACELMKDFENSAETVIATSELYLPEQHRFGLSEREKIFAKLNELLPFGERDASSISRRLFASFEGEKLLKDAHGKEIKKIGLVPATKIVLENLDWFIEKFDDVIVADSYKKGEIHFGLEVITPEELLDRDVDVFFLTTNMPSIESYYLDILPAKNTLCLSQLLEPIRWHHFDHVGIHRAKRILKEIESAKNPLVVLSSKLLATAEPMFVGLEAEGYDVFVVSLWDRMENRQRTGYDPACDVYRNTMVTGYEQLYILQNLKKGKFWIYYDFFFNTGWDTSNAVITYGCAAAMMNMAQRPVILGMYDVIKPVCLNMDKQDQAFALYKTMLDLADAVVLTSKSEHIADYLSNTLLKNTPVMSFYRYSFPPEVPLEKLSKLDGERHIVGVTSFLGEVFEPNRVETKNSIRSMLRQGIHFHYYSGNEKVFAFRDQLPEEERRFFHIETPIWNQRELVRDMSKFDAGWLVGDEATIFAKLIFEVKDRFIRELFTLFVPNGVPTSSMTYGAAGLPVFISRQIKVMSEVYPKGCCIPLDMGEVDHLSVIINRMDWDKLHQIMQESKQKFSIFAQVPRLAEFLKSVPEQRKALES